MANLDYEENLAKVVLPRVPEIVERFSAELEASKLLEVSIPARAEHFQQFTFQIEISSRGYLLSFAAKFPESGYRVSNYVFEAGKTLPEILAWLRGPDCLREVLKSMREFDDRIGRGL